MEAKKASNNVALPIHFYLDLPLILQMVFICVHTICNIPHSSYGVLTNEDHFQDSTHRTEKPVAFPSREKYF